MTNGTMKGRFMMIEGVKHKTTQFTFTFDGNVSHVYKYCGPAPALHKHIRLKV